MKRTVIVTGLIRKPDVLIQYIEDIKQVKPEIRPNLIISTWTGEIGRYPELAAYFGLIDVTLSVRPETNVMMVGNAFHQTLTLDMALSLVDDDVLILKTRPDVYFPGLIEKFVALQPERAVVGTTNGGRVTSRFYVLHMNPATPFMWADMTFIGHASRVREMTRVPMICAINFERIVAEQWLWMPSFVSHLPGVEAYFRVQAGLIHNDLDMSRKTQDICKSSPLYVHAVAAHILSFYQNCRFMDIQPEPSGQISSIAGQTLDEVLFEPLTTSSIKFQEVFKVNDLTSFDIVDEIVRGDYLPSTFGAAVHREIQKLAAGDLGSRAQWNREAELLGQRLESEAGFGVSKAVRAKPFWTYKDQDGPLWSMR